MTPRAGRAIAWLSFALGIAVSVAGNIMHSAITPAGPGELVGAAFWPLALMLSIEILTRVRWQLGRWWMAARVVGLLLVGVVAAVLSYRHLAGLMTSWGEDTFNAHLGPLAVDGLMLLAATALLSISREVITEPVVEAEPIGQVTEIKETPAGIEMTARVTKPEPSWTTPEEKPKPKPAPSKLHIVDAVSEDAAVEAARQAFFQAIDTTGKPLSAQQVADMLDKPKSTVHRNYTSKWAQEQRRIVR